MEKRRPFWGRRAVAAVATGPGGAFTEPAAYTPQIDHVPGNSNGEFANLPLGFLLHGTRSGSPQLDADQEYAGTDNYVRSGASGLGWNATIGLDKVAIHMPWTEWGWNAYDASRILIAFEFSQPTLGFPIADAQIRAAAWAIAQAREATRERWGTPVPIAFWTHAEVEANGWIHHSPDGKTDVTAFLDVRGTADIKNRLRQRLAQLGIT